VCMPLLLDASLLDRKVGDQNTTTGSDKGPMPWEKWGRCGVWLWCYTTERGASTKPILQHLTPFMQESWILVSFLTWSETILHVASGELIDDRAGKSINLRNVHAMAPSRTTFSKPSTRQLWPVCFIAKKHQLNATVRVGSAHVLDILAPIELPLKPNLTKVTSRYPLRVAGRLRPKGSHINSMAVLHALTDETRQFVCFCSDCRHRRVLIVPYVESIGQIIEKARSSLQLQDCG
jgi:hypothetical protein